MFVEQRAGGSQGSSVWSVQLVLHRVCSNEQTLFHPFSLVDCQGCCKLSFLTSFSGATVSNDSVLWCEDQNDGCHCAMACLRQRSHSQLEWLIFQLRDVLIRQSGCDTPEKNPAETLTPPGKIEGPAVPKSMSSVQALAKRSAGAWHRGGPAIFQGPVAP